MHQTIWQRFSTTTPFLLVAVFVFWGSTSQADEYLPGMEWDEPVVISPGDKPGAPPSDATILFDGTDLSAWQNGDRWLVEDGIIICGKGKGSIKTKEKFGDCQLHIEWMVSPDNKGSGQHRGNSGVFLMEKFEVQVLDSFKNKTYPEGQAAAIYKQTPPMVNVMRPRGEWNIYDIFWNAPILEGDEVIKNAFITVVHNGVLVVNHHELPGATNWDRPPDYKGLTERDEEGNLVGSIMLQDHRHPVRFRNIWVRDLKAPTGTPRTPMMIDHKAKLRWPAGEPRPESK